jgi:formylglycine-generating enzyme required for sulfatase activity
MVHVPAGEFLMGSTDAQVEAVFQDCKTYHEGCMRDWYEWELPQHIVTLAAFWIDQAEVTNAQYRKCLEAGTCTEPDDWSNNDFNQDKQPVVGVDWSEAQVYCQWARARLPTEAEWEKAARGTDGRTYPWGNDEATCQYAVMEDGNGYGCGRDNTRPVGSKPEGASPYGALDMAGNVWEWTASLGMAYPYRPDDGREDVNTPGKRVLRGGSFLNYHNYVRSVGRYRCVPYHSYVDIGFRCCVTSTSSP